MRLINYQFLIIFMPFNVLKTINSGKIVKIFCDIMKYILMGNFRRNDSDKKKMYTFAVGNRNIKFINSLLPCEKILS